MGTSILKRSDVKDSTIPVPVASTGVEVNTSAGFGCPANTKRLDILAKLDVDGLSVYSIHIKNGAEGTDEAYKARVP